MAGIVEPQGTKRPRKSLFERKQHEAMRVSCIVKGLKVSFWPNAYFPEVEGSMGNLFSVDVDSDVTGDMWLDWRDGKNGKLSLPLAAELLWMAGAITTMAEKVIAREKLDRAEVEALLDKLIERSAD